jgi:hypothetical protein
MFVLGTNTTAKTALLEILIQMVRAGKINLESFHRFRMALIFHESYVRQSQYVSNSNDNRKQRKWLGPSQSCENNTWQCLRL